MKRVFRIMKVTTFLLFALFFQVSAAVFSQSSGIISLKAENESLKEILGLVEDQSKYRFLYNSNNINVEQKKSIDCQGKSIEEVLDMLLKGTGITYRSFERNYVLFSEERDRLVSAGDLLASSQQQRTVSGTVNDESGQPLPGVTVVVKGTTQGTVTNSDGDYSLTNILEDATLVFSFVGMRTQEISVAGKSTINVTMAEEAIGIEEVVAIGYGTKKKSDLTAAVESVNEEVLVNRPVKTVGEMLEGVVPNLNIDLNSGAPDSNPSFNIRGFTGFDAAGSPLILVDGAEQNINSINPNDIESISVLKDAAASAIYGSRAPNGIILITTKSGKKGTPMKVNYSVNFDVNQPTYLPHTMNSVTYAKYVNMLFNNSKQEGYYAQDVIQKMQDFIDGVGPENSKREDGTWAEHNDAHGNTDYYGYAYRNLSTNLSHNLNLSGGSDKTTYYMGLGYTTKQGVMNSDVDEYNRMSTILKVNSDVTDWFNVGMNTRYSRIKTIRPNYRGRESGENSDRYFMSEVSYFPNIPIKNPDGNYHRLSAMPVLEGLQGTINNVDNDFWIIPSIELRPLEGLKLKSSFSWNTRTIDDFHTIFQVYVDRGNGTLSRSARSSNYDGIEQTMSKTEYYQLEANAEYKFKYNDHDFLFLTGFQQEYNHYNNLNASRNDLYNTEVPTFSTAYGNVMNIDDRIFKWATRGVYFRGSYNYQSKYLVDFNARYDASSKFSENNRWAFFPSISVGYNLAKEKFWPFTKINTLKLTGSWGKSGNHGLGTSNYDLYTYLPTLGAGLNNVILDGDFQPYVSIPPLVSADLTWAKPRTIGFGFETGIFNNRLQTEFRWYQRTVFDQFSPPITLPEVLGAAVPKTNNGVSETRGWEVSVSWKDKTLNIAGSPVFYNVKGVMSDYIGYVVNYGDPNASGLRGTWTPGEVFGVLYGSRSAGIAPNEEFLANHVPVSNEWFYPGDLYYQDLNGDGQINSGEGNVWYAQGDRVKLGYNYPRYRYSIFLNASWKEFSLNVLLNGVGHERFWSTDSRQVFGHASTVSWSTISALTLHEELGYWSLDNQDAFFPRIYQTNSKVWRFRNDQYLLNLAHLRIKNISLSYSVPISLINKLKLSNADINLSIENLGMIYYKSWLKLDPIHLRNNLHSYPIQRVFSLGINVTI